MTTLVTTSVVRGSHQGESHGGVYLIDLDNQQIEQKLDWNTIDIDWSGRGADRGLRGIAFDGELVYIAASDELFAFSPEFQRVGAWRNPYLRHCHEICVWEDSLYLASTGFDSVLGFNLDRRVFDRGFHFQTRNFKFSVTAFDPAGGDGPLQLNRLHINNVYCDANGMYVSGTKSGGMLHFNGRGASMAVELPAGSHNARPFRDGVLFNDTSIDRLRYCGRGEGEEDRAMAVPAYDLRELTHTNLDDSRIARQGFARGLCVLSDGVVAGGSSPSTVTLYDLAGNRQLLSVGMTMDVRNAIHGLEVWPFD
jgi:hypothetical protein